MYNDSLFNAFVRTFEARGESDMSMAEYLESCRGDPMRYANAAERLLAAGAMGYIMKQAASDQLLIAVRRVLDGRTYVSETVQRSLDQRAGESRSETNDPVSRLSNREVQILNMIGRGMSSREIAQEFTLSVKTIESHRQTIKHKLGLATNSQLLQYAMKWFSGGTQRQ